MKWIKKATCNWIYCDGEKVIAEIWRKGSGSSGGRGASGFWLGSVNGSEKKRYHCTLKATKFSILSELRGD